VFVVGLCSFIGLSSSNDTLVCCYPITRVCFQVFSISHTKNDRWLRVLFNLFYRIQSTILCVCGKKLLTHFVLLSYRVFGEFATDINYSSSTLSSSYAQWVPIKDFWVRRFQLSSARGILLERSGTLKFLDRKSPFSLLLLGLYMCVFSFVKLSKEKLILLERLGTLRFLDQKSLQLVFFKIIILFITLLLLHFRVSLLI
jgi:hypothetical protein